LDCAHLILVCTAYSSVHTSFSGLCTASPSVPDIMKCAEIFTRLVRGFPRYFRDLLEVFLDCAHLLLVCTVMSSVHTSFSGLCTAFFPDIHSMTLVETGFSEHIPRLVRGFPRYFETC